MNHRLKYTIILLMAVILGAVFIVFGASLGASVAGKTQLLNGDTAATWVASLSTVVIALLTIILALETQEMRRLQQEQIDKLRLDAIRPDVDLYLRSSEAAFNLSDLVLRNNGNGMAKNVRIVMEHVPNRGSANHANDAIEKLRKPSFIANGISTLGPRRELSSFVVSFFDIAQNEAKTYFDVCIEATITCLDSDGNEHTSVSVIDLAEFKGMVEVGGRPAHDVAKEMKAIRELLGHMTTGFKKLSIDTFTSEDRRIKRDNDEKFFNEQKQKRLENTTTD